MKIALPSRDGKVDGHFGHCEYFSVFEIEDNEIKGMTRFDPPPGCGCKSNAAETLAGMGVTVMLAGNMGGGAVRVLEAQGIEVVRGCSGELADVVGSYLAGKVSDSGEGCSSGGHECGHDH